MIVVEAKKDFLNKLTLYMDDILAAITSRINFPTTYQKFDTIDETNIQSMNTEFVDMYMNILTALMKYFPNNEKVINACNSVLKKSLGSLVELQQSIVELLNQSNCKFFFSKFDYVALKILYFNIFTRNALKILNSITKMALHGILKLSNSQIQEILLVISETKLPRSKESEIALKVSTSLTS